MVAMNSQTYAATLRSPVGRLHLLYDSTWPLDAALRRDDVTYIGVPLAQLCNENFREPRERILMKNIAYRRRADRAARISTANVCSSLLEEKYGRKKALRESNQKALKLGYDYVRRTFPVPAAVPSGDDGRATATRS